MAEKPQYRAGGVAGDRAALPVQITGQRDQDAVPQREGGAVAQHEIERGADQVDGCLKVEAAEHVHA